MMTIAILLFIGAVALGFYEGRNRSRTLILVISGATIMGISNLISNWPWFVSDASTWFRTYSYGLLQTGVLSFALHVFPFISAYLIGRRTRPPLSASPK